MKALSLTQPWASAIMFGHKRIETRSWNTTHRGRIAIHAAKGFPKWAKEFAQEERFLGRMPGRLPLMAIVGFATITGMRRTEDMVGEVSGLERRYGDYGPGRWAWMLSDILPIPDDKIVPAMGALGLWSVPEEIDVVLRDLLRDMGRL